MDFDNDGIKDLILGNRPGSVLFYKRKSDLTLEGGIELTDSNGSITITNNSKPSIIDWNNDGLLDLFLTGAGLPFKCIGRLYINEGTLNSHKYKSYTDLFMNGDTLPVGESHYSQLADINEDGLFDIISSRNFYNTVDNGFILYENNSSDSLNRFNIGENLKKYDASPIKTWSRTSFYFADWNGDGTIDLIYSDANNTMFVSYGKRFQTKLSKNNKNQIDLNNIYNLSMNNNTLYISNNDNAPITISIFALNGKVVFKNHSINSNEIYISRKFSSGIFLLELKIKGNVINKTIVLTK